MKKNNTAVGTYTYDSTGMRIKKTAGGVTTTYHVMNGVCYGETRSDGKNLQYVFDENGRVIGFRVQESGGSNRYYFVFNAQGDVVQLLHASGRVYANYTYDTWGRCTVTSGTGGTLSATDIGNINPFRYRGYYYDTETGLYYLQSRYYDPVVGRWISPEPNVFDGAFDGGAGPYAYNLYLYCANNPINATDPTGEFIISTVALCVIAGAAIFGTVGGLYGNYKANQVGAAGWEKVGYIAGYGTAGAFLGGGIGYFAAPAVVSMTGVAGISISSAGVSTVGVGGGSLAAEKASSSIDQALKQLNNSGLRPGQTQISASGVMNYVNNPKLLQGTGEVFRDGSQRFLVDGHHRLVAQTILGKGNFYTMPTCIRPSATNIYWSKHWWEFGKTAIKVVK